MKVLWFSNTPASGEEFLGTSAIRGGWLSSLDKALSGKVELSVAFYYARFAEPFQHNGVMYYPICKKNWKFNIIKKNLLGDFINKEDLSIYFDIIKKIQPDIIHIHGTENPFGCIMGAINIPIVLSIQGNCTVYNHKFFIGIESKFASEKKLYLLSPFTWLFNKSYNHQFKNSSVKSSKREQQNLKNCNNIIGRTDWDKRITRVLAPQSKYYHNDEILRDLFFHKEWKKNNHKTFIIHSTIGEGIFKGFETVCQSIYLLTKTGFDIEWRVAGVSADGLLCKVVKNKLKDKYPVKGLILLGNINEQKLSEKMLEADLYVMPSHIENSPNSLCEAMILGMPCITTLAGGSSSLLKDKIEGIVIQDGDPWSLAGAILELYRDPELAQSYGSNARRRALIRHNPQKIVNELLDIYNQIKKQND